MDCGQPENIEHGTWRLLSNETFYTAQVAYECPENWKLDGRLRRFCQENGTWAGETPKCIGEDFDWVWCKDWVYSLTTRCTYGEMLAGVKLTNVS